jgi:tetratricopeptide (TPR) repeat protein
MTWFPAPKRTATALAGTATILLSLWGMPAIAGDPFRTSNPRNIGDNTEAAFEAIFKDGDYQQARRFLSQAEASESSEPLVYAMQASLAYIEQDWETLNRYASKTIQAAEQLVESDPLRGNLYSAVGHFLEGAHDFKQRGPIGALAKLQKVFGALDEAKKLEPNDPELNLLTGYMDLMLAVNLPFTDPAQAVAKLEQYGSPSYLAYRGIAVGYRDLKQYDEAMKYVDRALELTPNNPEVLYLKAQILVKQDRNQESLEFFRKALAKQAQLPSRTAAQITYEECKADREINNSTRNCREELLRVRARDS